VFEDHLPERVCLPDHPIRVGSKVAYRADAAGPNFVVTAVNKAKATVSQTRHADGGSLNDDELSAAEPLAVAVSDLVVVAEFGDPIYPGMRVLGSVERGDDKPHHVVIKGDNHHVLEAMQFTHAGRVDVIYIDPPYNTGARDWKYDNDYVDENDGYRHSKWLAFMHRRLLLAKELLKPTGVLIVTIDEHEVHHLGVLLEQMFPNHRRPMVTILMNSAGNTQSGFYRVEEHAFFCFPPGVGPVQTDDDMLAPEDRKPRSLWGTHIRSGGVDDRPSKRPNMVYPIAIDPETGRFAGCGRSLEDRLDARELGDIATRAGLDAWLPDPDETLNGHPVLWPFSKDGDALGRWRNDARTFTRLVDEGFVRIRSNPNAPGTNTWSVSYVTEGNRAKVADGVIPVLGRDERDGSLLLGSDRRPVIAKTVWKRRLHDATNWGSPILRAFIGSNPFTYPKSPYAVRDALSTVVANNPDALIVDFFAGSGTTLQATAMLNVADGGRRQCILVTNNEVGNAEANDLRSHGHRPGDPAWESRGIYELVTRPRCEAVLTGLRRDGQVVEGAYEDGTAYSEGFPENVLFTELTFEDPNRVELDLSFEAVAPLLWLRAGAVGPVIAKHGDEDQPHAITEHYGVLFDSDGWRSFVAELPETVRTVFIVTDSAATFSQVCAELPTGVDAVRLYENYLTTFRYGGQST
jgi:adenine-specific DNA-methyltransferase